MKDFVRWCQELLWFWNNWSCRSDGKSETSRRNGIRKQRQKQKKRQQWNRWQEVTLQYTKNCKKGLSKDCQGSTFHAARAEEMAKADETSKTQRIKEWDKRNNRWRVILGKGAESVTESDTKTDGFSRCLLLQKHKSWRMWRFSIERSNQSGTPESWEGTELGNKWAANTQDIKSLGQRGWLNMGKKWKKTWRQSILQSLLCDEHIEHFGTLSVGHKKMHGKETIGTFRELTKKLEEVMGCFGGRLPQQGSPSQKQTSGRDISRADFVTERICREAFTMSEGIKNERWRNGASQGPRTLRHCFLFDTGPSIWNGHMLKNFNYQDLAVISWGQFAALALEEEHLLSLPLKPTRFSGFSMFFRSTLGWNMVLCGPSWLVWYGDWLIGKIWKDSDFFQHLQVEKKNPDAPNPPCPPFFGSLPQK